MLKSIVVPLLAVVLISASPVCGEKITSDPNTLSTVKQTDPPKSTDERLNQKINYDGVNKRLYNIVDDLSKTSGITLHCGKSSSDWKVRDVPVLVCSRDLSLDVLLRALADTTHLLLSKSTISDVTYYRMWRDLKREKELAAFEESKEAALLAAISYDWDALTLLKDVPKSTFEDEYAKDSGDPEASRQAVAQIRSISETIAELGPEAKDRVLAGDPIFLSYKYAPNNIKPHIKSLFESFWKMMRQCTAREGQEQPAPLDEDKLNRCYINVSDSYRDNKQELSIQISGSGCGFSIIHAPEYIQAIKKIWPNLPPRPEIPKPNLQTETLDKRYIQLSLETKEGPEFLDMKVKLPPLKEGEKPDYPKLLCTVSKATGYSLIADGAAARFLYGITDKERELAAMYGKEITPRAALAFAADPDKMQWYVDEKNKLILGRDKDWTEHLKALVPEKMLQDLSDKLKGSGVELDDLEPLAGLTRSQVMEWIRQCPEFPEISKLENLSGEGLMQLYFGLTPEERGLAKAGTSVPLIGCDQVFASSVLCKEISEQKERITSIWRPEMGEPEILKADAFINPDTLTNLTIRIEKEDFPKPQESKHRYTIRVNGQDDHPLNVMQWLNYIFPIKATESKPQQ